MCMIDAFLSNQTYYIHLADDKQLKNTTTGLYFRSDSVTRVRSGDYSANRERFQNFG